MARARASAASAGRGRSGSPRIRVTMFATWSLPARPDPVTAALTSLGVCITTGMPSRAAARIATPAAWAVPITVATLFWLNTRSTATTSGRTCSSQPSTASEMPSSRCARSASDGVRITSTATSVARRPGKPSTTPSPQRVNPGSTPSTRMSARSHPNPHGANTTHREPRPALIRAGCRHHFVGGVEVGVDVLHVVAVLERLDQPEDLASALFVQRHAHARDELRVGGVVVDIRFLERGAHGDQVGRLADHLESLTEVVDLLGPGVQHRTQDVVLGERSGLRDD